MGFCAGMDSTLYFHGNLPLLDPRDRHTEPGCKIRVDPFYFPACAECHMVISLFWSSFNVLQLLNYRNALGSTALYYRPVIPVLHSGCNTTHPVFLLDIVCCVPELRNPYHESHVFWDIFLGKEIFLSLF